MRAVPEGPVWTEHKVEMQQPSERTVVRPDTYSPGLHTLSMPSLVLNDPTAVSNELSGS